jgi:TatD DNase family protein
MIIDSHAHLDLLEDYKAALERARQAKVIHVVTIGVDLETSAKAAEFAKQEKNVSFCPGIHPHDAAEAPPDYQKQLLDLAQSNGAVGWGECGLDYYYNKSPKQEQRRIFSEQIEAAKNAGLPLVIHDRDAHEEVLELLAEQDAGQVGGVIHCFSGDEKIARKALDLGFHLGVTGTITFPKSEDLRKAVAITPLERLLVETDCPFLAPVPKRGKPNEPSYLPYTVTALAKVLKMDPEKLARTTTQNTSRLFGLNLD